MRYHRSALPPSHPTSKPRSFQSLLTNTTHPGSRKHSAFFCLTQQGSHACECTRFRRTARSATPYSHQLTPLAFSTYIIVLPQLLPHSTNSLPHTLIPCQPPLSHTHKCAACTSFVPSLAGSAPCSAPASHSPVVVQQRHKHTRAQTHTHTLYHTHPHTHPRSRDVGVHRKPW